jgi:rhodanese-related sulfurtransferase
VANVGEMGVRELASWETAGSPYTLLDVRTDMEVELASMHGALHIPMHEIPFRIREIPRNRPVVVMCHHGERSYRVARFLLADGFHDVYNLEGGIDAYAAEVDSSIPRY